VPQRIRRFWAHLNGQPARASYEVALVILPGDEVQNHARRLQVELKRRFPRAAGVATQPHITLKLGFGADTLEGLEAYLDELAAGLERFDVGVGAIDCFDEGIVFLDVERHPRLEQLRRRMLNDLRARFGVEAYALEAGDAYRFHITLAHGLSPADLELARRELTRPATALRFELERLALFYYSDEGWVSHKCATIPGGIRERTAIS